MNATTFRAVLKALWAALGASAITISLLILILAFGMYTRVPGPSLLSTLLSFGISAALGIATAWTGNFWRRISTASFPASPASWSCPPWPRPRLRFPPPIKSRR